MCSSNKNKEEVDKFEQTLLDILTEEEQELLSQSAAQIGRHLLQCCILLICGVVRDATKEVKSEES